MALQELIYMSLARAAPDLADAGNPVKNILESAQRNNVATSITGLLMFDGQRYIQILEGESGDVDSLFAVIAKDPRHEQLELLHKGSVRSRSFADWSMAHEALPPGLLDDLAEKMAVYSMELNGAVLDDGESFGAKLNVMFMDAMAAE